MEPIRRTVELARTRVSLLEWRPDTERGSTVLLLHGGGLDSAWLSWGGIGADLAAAGHHVVAPDHPGYGDSPAAPWTATHQHLLGYVGQLAAALELDRYVVGGISMGGALTLGHVLDHDARAVGAILLGSYGIMDRQVRGLWSHPWHLVSWAMTHTGVTGAAMRATGRHRALLEASMRSLVRNPEQRTPELIEAVLAGAARGAGLTAFEEFQRDEIRLGRLRTNYLSRLAEFPIPALVVHGDHDTGVPIEDARRAAAAMPDATLVEVVDAGHWVQRDRPEVVVPAVLDFLDRVS